MGQTRSSVLEKSSLTLFDVIPFDVQIKSVHIEIRSKNMYNLNVYKKVNAMPQIPVENNDRISLRIASKEKSLLMRAAALQHTNLTEFVIRTVVSAAREVIDQSERMQLTERDRLHVLNLLEEPPAPNEKLIAAAFALPKRS